VAGEDWVLRQLDLRRSDRPTRSNQKRPDTGGTKHRGRTVNTITRTITLAIAIGALALPASPALATGRCRDFYEFTAIRTYNHLFCPETRIVLQALRTDGVTPGGRTTVYVERTDEAWNCTYHFVGRDIRFRCVGNVGGKILHARWRHSE
jgi:hypothetical protein